MIIGLFNIWLTQMLHYDPYEPSLITRLKNSLKSSNTFNKVPRVLPESHGKTIWFPGPLSPLNSPKATWISSSTKGPSSLAALERSSLSKDTLLTLGWQAYLLKASPKRPSSSDSLNQNCLYYSPSILSRWFFSYEHWSLKGSFPLSRICTSL